MEDLDVDMTARWAILATTFWRRCCSTVNGVGSALLWLLAAVLAFLVRDVVEAAAADFFGGPLEKRARAGVERAATAASWTRRLLLRPIV